MKKRILAILLVAAMMVSVIPFSVFAESKTVIDKIVVTSDFEQPTYGSEITSISLSFTVEDDLPIVLDMDGFDWFWYDEDIGGWEATRSGHFSAGTWTHDFSVRLSDTENYEFNNYGVEMILDGVNLGVQSLNENGSWVRRAPFEIEYIPAALPLAMENTFDYYISVNYIDRPINSINFSGCVWGGTQPYTFSKTGGPSWLSLTEAGVLSGTPTEVGENEAVTITVTDALGATASIDINIDDTYTNPNDREVVSRVVGTADLPAFECGYELDGSKILCSVSEGAPATLSANGSDFYEVDSEGNRGTSVEILVGGNTYTMDLCVEIIDYAGTTHMLDAENLEVIINGEETTYEYVTIRDDASYVWVCLPPFTVEHVFDNDSDATCNGCDFTREGCAHEYATICGEVCTICGETRVVKHSFDGSCDTKCNYCEYTREGTDHTYHDCYDNTCNICGAERDTPAHIYDDCYDGECNACLETRGTPAHVYSGYTDLECDICGEVREPVVIGVNQSKTVPITHPGQKIEYLFTPTITCRYFFESFTDVDTKGYVLDIEGNQLAYDDDSGEDSNFRIVMEFEAGVTYVLRSQFYDNTLTGQISFALGCMHSYSGICDEECDACGYGRVAPHDFDNALDTVCNSCSKVRELNYIPLGERVVAKVTGDPNYLDYVFVPRFSGDYVFTSFADADTTGTLFDENGAELSYSDDDSEIYHQFLIEYSLEAGKKYIFRASFYDADRSGDIPVMLYPAADVNEELLIGRTILARDKMGLRFQVMQSQVAGYDSFYVEVKSNHFISNNTERYAKTEIIDRFCYIADNAQVPEGFTKQSDVQNGIVFFDYTGISAYEMSLSMDVTLYCISGDSIVNKSQTWTYSLADVILGSTSKALENSQSKNVTAYVDMINYGAAVQAHFAAQFPTSDLGTQALPTVGFESYQQYATPDATASISDAVNITSGVANNGSTAMVGRGLKIQAANELNFPILASTYDVNNLTLNVSYTNSYGADKSKNYAVSDMELVGGIYYCYLDNDKQVALYDTASPIVAKLYNGSELLFTMTYSVESFFAGSGLGDTTVEVGDKLMKFTHSLRALLNLA